MYRLSWRVATEGGALLPALLALSEDVADGQAARRLAARVAGEAFGGEFRMAGAGASVVTGVVEIDAWRPDDAALPRPLTTTVWGREGERAGRIAVLRVALRDVLDSAAADGLLGDDEALGLRRAAEIMMAGRMAA